MKTTERIIFRLMRMPCCGQLLCWVNPRIPNYCPECGKKVFEKVRRDEGVILIRDENAFLKVDFPENGVGITLTGQRK